MKPQKPNYQQHKQPQPNVLSYVKRHPALFICGVFASFGGVATVTTIVVQGAIHAIVIFTGFQLAGLLFLYQGLPVAIGILLGFIAALAVSGFGQAIALKVVGATYYGDDEPWYGAVRVGLRNISPLTVIWLFLYLIGTLFVLGMYRLGIVSIGNMVTKGAEDAISIVTVAIIAFVLGLLAIVAMNASCFSTIHKMHTWKSITAGFDMFTQLPMRSIGMVTLFSVLWLGGVGVMLAFYALSLALFSRIEQWTGLQFSAALLNLWLLGILFVTNALLSTFWNVAWALFFLKNVSVGQLPKAETSQDHRLQGTVQA